MAATRFSRPHPLIAGKQDWSICTLTQQGHLGCITHAESAFSAAVDPNRMTEMTIAAIDRDIQASE
jgi:hypothetical protein